MVTFMSTLRLYQEFSVVNGQKIGVPEENHRQV